MLGLHSYYNSSILNEKINLFFKTFKKEILLLSTKQWNNEDLKGIGFQENLITDYHSLLQLLILIQLDINITGKKQNWSYYYSKYNISNIEKCLICKGINFKKAIEIFGFFTNCSDGIECIEISNTFLIEPTVLSSIPVSNITSTSTTFLNNLLNINKNCTLNIISIC